MSARWRMLGSSSTPGSTSSTATGARSRRPPRTRTAFLKTHTWDEYALWHLGLTDGASDETKGRYAFVYGDFRRVHRTGLIACVYRRGRWRHKAVELAAHDLLQHLDKRSAAALLRSVRWAGAATRGRIVRGGKAVGGSLLRSDRSARGRCLRCAARIVGSMASPDIPRLRRRLARRTRHADDA